MPFLSPFSLPSLVLAALIMPFVHPSLSRTHPPVLRPRAAHVTLIGRRHNIAVQESPYICYHLGIEI
mgnify:CR=1 FL=1